MTAERRAPALRLFRTVRGRLLFWILVVVTPIYAGAIYLSYQATAQRLQADAVREVDQLTAGLASGLDALIRPIEGGVHTVAHQLEAVDPPRAEYPQRIRGILEAWPEVYGSTIAVETEGTGTLATPYAPYLFRKDGDIHGADLALDSYAYHSLPWYRQAADGGKPVWSSPYFDRGGGQIWMVTYSVPFFARQPDGERRLAGVVTADLDLEWVRRTAASTGLGAIGMGWLYPDDDDAPFNAPVGDTPARAARFDGQLDASTLRAAGEGMLARGESFARLPDVANRKPAYLAVRNLSTLDWHLVLVIPRDDLLAEARQLLNRQILLGALGLLLLVVAISVVAAGITRPIRRLAAAVGGADVNDLHFHLPGAARRDEIGVLTGALRRLRDSLQQHVQLRAQNLAAETRLAHELEVSAQIQQSMLPHGESLRALPAAVEVAVALQPARQVGGDLYDCFALHDGQVLFTVGDVSDKGIPAALFMARLSAMVRMLGVGGHDPGQLLAEINDRLVEGNDACMFATVCCGVLDPASGAFRYASAGHDAPLLRPLEGPARLLAMESGGAIGIDAGARYPLQQCFMAPGDTLLLYTDGVTEAEAAGGVQFGQERLISLVDQAADTTPAALIAQVVEAVHRHADGLHASDDLTVLTVRFRPDDVTPRVEASGPTWTIQVGCSPAGVARALARLRGILLARGVDAARLHDAELITEEWLSNVVRAAGKESRRQLSLLLLLTPGKIHLTFRDDGSAFNPLEAGMPDLDCDIGERRIGGLGLHLIRELAERCHYTRIDERNVLQIQLRRDS